MSQKWVMLLWLALFVAAPGQGTELMKMGNADLSQPGDLAAGDWHLWSRKRIVTPHALRFVADVHGLSAARFEIRPDDPKVSDGYRAELRDAYVASPGEEIWYRFSTLIPAQVADADESLVLAQWHDRKTRGRPARRPPLALRLVRGALRVTLWNDAVFEEQGMFGAGRIIYETREFARDQWLDVDAIDHVQRGAAAALNRRERRWGRVGDADLGAE